MWLMLAGSLIALPFASHVSLALLAGCLLYALNLGVLEPSGAAMLMIVTIVAIVRISFSQRRFIRVLAELALVLSCVGLTLHLVPGFHNQKVLDAVFSGPLSAPFTMYYNLDKALIPFILMACTGTLFCSQAIPPRTKWCWVVLILACPVLLCLATLFGGLKFEVHWPEWLGQFILANIFFVSLAEEAFFRGYLQQRLAETVPPYVSLLLTSALFGVLHYSGGVLLMLFAGIAGIIYGLAWMWSGRLWVSTLFHFMFNLLHLLFFTYPVYKPA